MEIKKEIIGDLNELITVVITPEDYQPKVEKSLKDLKRRLIIPGFRQGMAPMGMIQKLHGKSVVAEEVYKLAENSFNDYLRENSSNILFEPIAHAEKTVADFEKTEDFSFSYEIGLRPEIEINYEEAKKVVDYKITATAEEIDTEIMALRKRAGVFSSTETVADDDMLLLSVTPPNAEEFTSSILLNYVKDKELKNFIGKKLHDEMDIDTTKIFKSEYERSTFLKVKIDALETAPTNVHIKIDAIHHTEPSEIDDEFFKKIFPEGDINNEIQLKEHIKKHVELRYVNDANIVYQNNIIKILEENTLIPLPDDFIKRYLMEKQQDNIDSIEEKYDATQKYIKYQLLEAKIVEDCNLYIEEEEVFDYMRDYIRKNHFGSNNLLDQEQEEQIKMYATEMMKNKENKKNVYDNIFLLKFVQAFREKLNPKAKKLSYKSFIDEIGGKKEKSTPKTKAKSKEKTEEKTEEKEIIETKTETEI